MAVRDTSQQITVTTKEPRLVSSTLNDSDSQEESKKIVQAKNYSGLLGGCIAVKKKQKRGGRERDDITSETLTMRTTKLSNSI